MNRTSLGTLIVNTRLVASHDRSRTSNGVIRWAFDPDLLEGFRRHLLRKGLRPSTISARLESLGIVAKSVSSLAPTEIDRYLTKQYEAGRRGSYLNQLIFGLREWGAFTGDSGLKATKLFRNEPTHKAVMSDDEITAFLSLSPQGARRMHDEMTLYFRVLAFSGMRPTEAATLTTRQVDLGREVFDLTYTKTAPRIVPIAAGILPELVRHMRSLESDNLFAAVTHNTRRYHFNQRLDRLGIDRKGLTPHSLRHSFITRMLGEDINLFKIQRIVGHRNASTTQRYTHLTSKDIAKALQRDPLAKTTLTPRAKLQAVKEKLRVIVEEAGLPGYLNETDESVEVKISL